MDKDKYLKEAIKLAKSSIYNGAQYLGSWKSYAVYEPTIADDEPRFIGFPQFILANSSGLRFTDSEKESRSIMREFDSGE